MTQPTPRKLDSIPDELLERAARGDRDAQQELLSQIYGFVRKTLYQLQLGNPHDLADLQQQALLGVLTSVGRFRRDGPFSAWVASICVHVFRDHLRKKKRSPIRLMDVDEAPTPVQPSPMGAIEARIALNDCARALRQMSENHRTVFILRNVHGYSIREIAKMMNSAESTTRLRLYYARRFFKRMLRTSDLGFLAQTRDAEAD